MRLRSKLTELAKAISEAADRDAEFAARLERILGAESPKSTTRKPATGRPKNRRPAAVLDPVAVVVEGENVLRQRLADLTLDQLKDVVAEYGMDPGKLVMKWKDPARVIDRIVEISLTRSQKGNAFRAE